MPDFLRPPRASFARAREQARALRLRSRLEWRRCAAEGRLPAGLPVRPDLAYAQDGWSGWPEFLGRWRPFGEARAFVRMLALRSVAEWRAFVRGERPDLPPPPADLPSAASYAYRSQGWVSWPDFLGTVGRAKRTSSKLGG